MGESLRFGNSANLTEWEENLRTFDHRGSTLRIEERDEGFTYKTGGRPADTSNYFFLPAQGCYNIGSLDTPGTGGYYWSSSPYPGLSATAYRLYFSSGLVSLYRNHRYNGFVAGSQWFK